MLTVVYGCYLCLLGCDFVFGLCVGWLLRSDFAGCWLFYCWQGLLLHVVFGVYGWRFYFTLAVWDLLLMVVVV